MTSVARRAHIWSWWGDSSETGEDLVFVAAARRRADLHTLCLRAGVAPPQAPWQLPPSQPGYAAALHRPAQLLWMPLDRFAARATTWFDEEQLSVARRARVVSIEPSLDSLQTPL